MKLGSSKNTIRRDVLYTLTVFLAVYVFARLADQLSSTSIPLFALRLQVAILVCAFLIYPKDRWPCAMLAGFLGLLLAGNLGAPLPVPVFAALTVAEAGVCAFFLSMLGSEFHADDTRHLTWLVIISTLATSIFEPDLILMDIQMPDMDGIECAKRIRSDLIPAKRSVPIVAITGYTMELERNRCQAAGMDGFLTKPFTNATFLQAVSRDYPRHET